MHGKFNFGNLANFVSQFVEMKLGEMGAAGGSQEPPRAQQQPAAPKKELGPLPELSAANFDAECKSAGGLCAVALLDGAAENSNKAAHLEMLTQLRKRKAGRSPVPLACNPSHPSGHPSHPSGHPHVPTGGRAAHVFVG